MPKSSPKPNIVMPPKGTISDRLYQEMLLHEMNLQDVVSESGLAYFTVYTAMTTGRDIKSSTLVKLLKAFPQADGHYILTGESL